MARPALQLAHPSGAVRMLEAIGWVRDTSGRWRICLLWYADQSEQTQREDWFSYDSGRIPLMPEGLAGSQRARALTQPWPLGPA